MENNNLIKVKIDGVDISSKVVIGSSFHEKINYDLDEGQFTIKFVGRENPYEMWSKVDITTPSDEIIVSGRLSHDIVQLVSKKPLLYTHEIGITEHTKILEKYWISGKTFTQPLRGVEGTYTLLDVVEILRDTVQLRRTVDVNVGSKRAFYIPDETANLLSQYIAPELTFKEMTLRECIDETLSFIDSKCRLDRDKNLIIDFFNFKNNKFEGIRTTKISREQNINEYSTKLVSNIMNAVPNKRRTEFDIEGNEIFPSSGMYTTLRGREFVFSPDTSMIPTPNPIYKVNQVLVLSNIKITKKPTIHDPEETIFEGYKDYSIDRIIEKELYDTFDVVTSPNLELENETQQTYLFYEYGKPNIITSETYGVFDAADVLSNVLLLGAVKSLRGETFSGETLPPDMDKPTFVKDGVTWKIELVGYSMTEPFTYAKFRVQYLSIPTDIRIEIDREDTSEINKYTEMMTNQKSRIVDSESFTDNMLFTLNKKGLSDMELSHKTKNYSDSLNIGDYTEDGFIITEKETIFLKDHFRFLYKLNKNFNKTSLFVGLNAQVRQWDIGESGRTLERDVVYKEFINISAEDEQRETIKNFNFMDGNWAHEQLGRTFIPDEEPLPKVIENFVFQTFKNDTLVNREMDNNFNAIVLPPQKHYGGNSVMLGFRFKDNISVGQTIETEKPNILPIEQRVNEEIRYADFQGRFDYINFELYHSNPDIDYTNLVEGNRFGRRYPLVDKTVFPIEKKIGDASYYIKKDNREVLKFNFIYQFTAQNKDLIIGKYLISRNYLFSRVGINPIIPHTDPNPTMFKIRFYENYVFSKSDNEIAPDGVLELDLDCSYSDGVLTINNNEIFAQTVVSWAIVSEFGDLVIAHNGQGGKYIHFDLELSQKGVQDIEEIVSYSHTITENISLQTDITAQSVQGVSYNTMITEDLSVTTDITANSYKINEYNTSIEEDVSINIDIDAYSLQYFE